MNLYKLLDLKNEGFLKKDIIIQTLHILKQNSKDIKLSIDEKSIA